MVIFKMGLKREKILSGRDGRRWVISFHVYPLFLFLSHTNTLISFHTSSTNNNSKSGLYHMTGENCTLKKRKKKEEEKWVIV